METLYKKTLCDDNNPNIKDYYYTNLGEIFFNKSGVWTNFQRQVYPKWWLEELPPQEQVTPEISEKDIRNILEEKLQALLYAGEIPFIEGKDEATQTIHKLISKGAKPINDDWIGMLREFHKSFDLPLRDIPQEIPPKEFELRHNLLQEEVNEIAAAYSEIDLKEIFDGILDSIYVLIGTAVQMGFGDVLNAGFKEVHRSNMSKLGDDGKPILREDGKVIKGANFTKPNFEQFL